MNPHLINMIAQQRTAELQRAGADARLARDVRAAQHSPRRWSRKLQADTLVLTNGRRLRLRPIGAGHRRSLVALFDRLSPESRRLRYLGPKRELTSRELASLTDIDHVADEPIVAIDEHDGSIVGVARYAHRADRAPRARTPDARAHHVSQPNTGEAQCHSSTSS